MQATSPRIIVVSSLNARNARNIQSVLFAENEADEERAMQISGLKQPAIVERLAIVKGLAEKIEEVAPEQSAHSFMLTILKVREINDNEAFSMMKTWAWNQEGYVEAIHLAYDFAKASHLENAESIWSEYLDRSVDMREFYVAPVTYSIDRFGNYGVQHESFVSWLNSIPGVTARLGDKDEIVGNRKSECPVSDEDYIGELWYSYADWDIDAE